MKKSLLSLLLLTTLLVVTILVFPVEASEPSGGCPDEFNLHMTMDHDHQNGDHLHVGTDTDQNGDGWICAKHVSREGDIHVHIDNNTQKP